MKEFSKWLVEIDAQQPGSLPPVNGGVTPSLPPEIASELSSIAQKLNALIKKLGIGDKGEEDISSPEKGLGDKSMGDKGMGNAAPGPPPSFQT